MLVLGSRGMGGIKRAFYGMVRARLAGWLAAGCSGIGAGWLAGTLLAGEGREHRIAAREWGVLELLLLVCAWLCERTSSAYCLSRSLCWPCAGGSGLRERLRHQELSHQRGE